MITLKSVSTHWKDFSLRDINLEIKEGEYFVVLGPTGAGKTLLLELMAGFWQPDGGTLEIFGEDVKDSPPEKRGMGFVYQDHMLFPHMNVCENIGFGLKLRGDPVNAVAKKVKRIAKTLGIQNLLARSPSTLSGGESQRVALARALILKPKILLLDEPLSALDPNVQERVRVEIKELHRSSGITTIHVTHNREEAMVLADRIAIMGNGKIYQVGKPDEIFRKPASRFVAEFVGVQNIFSGNLAKNGLVKLPGFSKPISTTSSRTGRVSLALRPEDIIIAPKEVKTSARNVIHGRVNSIMDKGNVMNVDVEIDAESDIKRTLTVYVTRLSLEELGITVGGDVNLLFKASAVHVF